MFYTSVLFLLSVIMSPSLLQHIRLLVFSVISGWLIQDFAQTNVFRMILLSKYLLEQSVWKWWCLLVFRWMWMRERRTRQKRSFTSLARTWWGSEKPWSSWFRASSDSCSRSHSKTGRRAPATAHRQVIISSASRRIDSTAVTSSEGQKIYGRFLESFP